MLMFDRISEISETGGEYGKGLVRAELEVNPDLWFFGCHFKNDPVMPGCLGLDAMWQMVGFYLGWIGGEEISAFGDGVGGDDQLMPGARGQDRRVILEAKRPLARQWCEILRDNTELVHGTIIEENSANTHVMAGHDPAIHFNIVLAYRWMAASRAAMTC